MKRRELIDSIEEDETNKLNIHKGSMMKLNSPVWRKRRLLEKWGPRAVWTGQPRKSPLSETKMFHNLKSQPSSQLGQSDFIMPISHLSRPKAHLEWACYKTKDFKKIKNTLSGKMKNSESSEFMKIRSKRSLNGLKQTRREFRTKQKFSRTNKLANSIT